MKNGDTKNGDTKYEDTRRQPRFLNHSQRGCRRVSSVIGLLALSFAGCGYHAGPGPNLLPATIHTIAVPQFKNVTVQYKLASYMSEAVTREFITRTRYKVVADSNQADATLYGNIVNLFSSATVSDPTTGRGTGAQIIVQVQIRLVAKDGKVLFTRPNYQFLDRYEISINPSQYIDESQVTLARLSRDLAQAVVSAILENF